MLMLKSVKFVTNLHIYLAHLLCQTHPPTHMILKCNKIANNRKTHLLPKIKKQL